MRTCTRAEITGTYHHTWLCVALGMQTQILTFVQETFTLSQLSLKRQNFEFLGRVSLYSTG